MKITNKVIIVTGASGGMGQEIGKQLSKKGCKLALFARREEKLKELCKEFKSDITDCIYKKCDVSNEKDVKEAIKFTIEKYGRIDIVFLNAGVLIPNPIENFDGSIIIKTMKINFFGTVYFLENLLPILKKQDKSHIVITSTLPDKRGVPGWGAYGASKAAISWLTESLRWEAKHKYNIRFTTVKPGSVKTPMIEEYERPGSISVDKAATIIIKGVEKNKRIIQFPFMQVMSTRIADLFPASLYDMLDLEQMKGEGFPEVEEKK